MKRFVVIAIVAALILAILPVGMVYAGSKYSNAKADFVMVGGSDAGGQAIINYVKGADKWIVQGKVWNLDPEKVYYVTLGKGGVWSWWVVAQVTTDDTGSGSFHEQVDAEHPFNNPAVTRPVANGDTYNIVRIWRVASLSPLQADSHYMVANENFGGIYSPETHGVLTFRGEQRGK